MITIFTDGSSKGNPGPGGWAAIVAGKGTVTELGGRENMTTNNRMELRAVIEGLKNAVGDSIHLHTDSEYIVKGITVWVKSWQKNNWRTAARKPVLNQDLWQELIEVSRGKDIKWIVVPGHAGVDANERCDVIATEFADGGYPPLYDGPEHEYTISFSVSPKTL
ncbi:MAG: ribonuclease HI [Patescibacteria group bacterium]